MIFLDIIWKIIVYIRLFLKKEDKSRYKERFGVSGKNNDTGLPLIWFHCVSVGEMNSALCLIEEILQTNSYFVLLTTTTTASAKIATNLNYNNFTHQFNPCDSPSFLRKFLLHWKPLKLVICESEFWPFMIKEASKVAKLYLINARLSEKSAKRWKIFGNFFQSMLLKFEEIFPTSNDTRNLFLNFKSNNISNVVCNTKFVNANIVKNRVQIDKNKISKINDKFDKKIKITIGSIHLSELIEIKKDIKKLIEFSKDIVIFLVPRYINLADDLQIELMKINLKSTVIENEDSFLNPEISNIIIVKKLGILHIFYAIANICITGGSLSFKTNGCHNPLESLFLNKITLVGQNNKNIKKTMPDLFQKDIIKIIDSNNFYNELKKIISINQDNLNIKEKIHETIIDNTKNKNIILKKILKS